MPNLIPMAQGFKITGAPSSVSQVFIESIDIAVSKKSSTAGMTVMICEVNGGAPDVSKIVPLSIVHLQSHQINAIGATATKTISNFTKFRFNNPICLLTNKEYAFIIQPDGNNTEYVIFTATRGIADLILGSTSSIPQPVGMVTLTDFYKGTDDNHFDANPNKYLQFVINRYKFTQTTATVTFNSANADYFTVANLTSKSMMVGDVIFGGNSTAVNTNLYGVITYAHANNNTLYIESSTGKFGVGNTIQIFRANGEIQRAVAYANSVVGTRIANATIYSIDDLKYHVVSPRFHETLPAGTSISYDYAGITGNNGSYSTTVSRSVVNGVENTFNDIERTLPSYSKSVTTLPTKAPITVTATLRSNSDFTTPKLTNDLSQVLVVTNHLDGVNANVYMEYFNTGSVATKYISKPVVLATGQDAEDIKVYVTAWRPPVTDLQIYAKFLSAQDSAPLSQKTWTLLTNDNPAVYSDALDPTDHIEYSFSLQNTVNDPALYLKAAGTLTSNLTSNTITGANVSSFNTQLQPGYILYNNSNVVIGTVSTIAGASSMTLTSNALVVLANNGFNYAASVIPPQTNAFLNESNLVQKSGTITVSNNSSLVTGSGTAFNTELQISNYIDVNGEQKYVVSVANSTSMTVDSSFTTSYTGVSYSQVLDNGLTYTDGSGVTYVKYKTFQIKMTMHSDNLVFTPAVHDLRAIALQS
jgi:hypothetical protein